MEAELFELIGERLLRLEAKSNVTFLIMRHLLPVLRSHPEQLASLGANLWLLKAGAEARRSHYQEEISDLVKGLEEILAQIS